MEAELEHLLAECPDAEEDSSEDRELAQELDRIDQKIQRLMAALAESTALTMSYINRTVEKLETQRRELLERNTTLHKAPMPKLDRLQFGSLDFEQKKLVAAHFIREVRLSGDIAWIIWKV